jgi:N-acetylneuraminic acid mutarotase
LWQAYFKAKSPKLGKTGICTKPVNSSCSDHDFVEHHNMHRSTESKLTCLVGIATASALAVVSAQETSVRALPALPDAHGFAGSFAGVLGDTLLVAGGANFPDGVMPWKGGKKVWHDQIFALDLSKKESNWRVVGTLPQANGYGVSIQREDEIIFIGGGNLTENFSHVSSIRWDEGKVTITPWPALPMTCANACAVIWKNHIHVIGGLEKPDSTTASARHFTFDLSSADATWKEAAPLPKHGLMLATAGTTDNALWVIGGCSLAADTDNKAVRTYQPHSWTFDGKSWERGPDLPRCAVAAVSSAWQRKGELLVVGGDDGSQVGKDPEKHQGFCKTIMRLDETSQTWIEEDALDAVLPVTAPSVKHGETYLLISGEIRPGVRTPNILELTRKP